MRPAITVIISFLIAIAPTQLAAAKSESDSRLVDVIVTISGNPACAFLPDNYVTMKSPELDRVFNSSFRQTEASVDHFIETRCRGLLERLDHTYGLLMRGFAGAVRESNLERLRSIPGIVSVERSKKYSLFETMANSPQVTRSEEAWKLKDFQGKTLTGHGQVIGVIDTGLDYRHPALGGKFGSNAKVINGIDYSTGKGIEIDPQAHGTQVAGAAAGNGKYKGSAPDAKLVGFKVYPETEDGGGTNVNSNILKAVEQSVAMKCTVLNLSLGSAGGESGGEEASDPYRNAIRAGVVICAAAGNNGARSDKKGFQVASPSTYSPVISCAATDDTRHLQLKIAEPANYAGTKIGGNPFDNPEIWPAGEYDVADCGYGLPEDFSGKDVKGKIVLIKRGPLGSNPLRFKDKALNSKIAGAIGCIIYNHSLSTFSGVMFTPDDKDKPELVPAVALSHTQGLKLKSLVDKGLKVSVSTGEAFGMMTNFSSMGPSTDIKFKPEVAAPGLGVMCPTYMGTTPNKSNPPYSAFSGTSCATPVISGVAALVRQKNPTDPPQLIKCRLMSTANLLFNINANEYIPLMLQGSGRVDAYKAALTRNYFNPPSLSLKAKDFTQKASVTLVNLSKEKAKAELSYWSVGRNTTCKMPLSVDLDPGKEAKFAIDVTCDQDAEGVLEGIIFAKIGEETIHLPLIIANLDIEIKSKMTDLKLSKDVMDFEDPKITSITFKINFGGFEPNVPGRDVTSNFAAGKLDLYNDEGLVGSILMDDTLQVGYYHIHWDGHDYLDRLFATSGSYLLKAVGLESQIESDIISIRSQSDPPAAAILIKNSPLLQMPAIKIKPVPLKPNLSEPFELRFFSSQFNKITSISATIRWDPFSFSIDKMLDDTAFGKSREGVRISPRIDNEKGTATVDIELDRDFSEDSSGFIFSFLCTPKQDGKSDFYLSNLGVNTLDGGYSPKEYGDYLVITNTYSRFDLNNDTVVDELDSDLLKRFLGLTYKDAQYKEHLDFNADGKIDSVDMVMLAKMFGFKKSPP